VGVDGVDESGPLFGDELGLGDCKEGDKRYSAEEDFGGIAGDEDNLGVECDIAGEPRFEGR